MKEITKIGFITNYSLNSLKLTNIINSKNIMEDDFEVVSISNNTDLEGIFFNYLCNAGDIEDVNIYSSLFDKASKNLLLNNLSETIEIPIYFGNLKLHFVKDLSHVNSLYGTDIDDSLYDAVTFKSKSKDVDEYVVVIKEVDWSIIAHEVVHLVNSIFLDHGIQLDRINDEPQAYFTGWVTKQIMSFIKVVEDDKNKIQHIIDKEFNEEI